MNHYIDFICEKKIDCSFKLQQQQQQQQISQYYNFFELTKLSIYYEFYQCKSVFFLDILFFSF